MREQEQLQEVNTLAHPPGVVIGSRSAELISIAFFSVNTSSKKDLRQLKELFVVSSRNR